MKKYEDIVTEFLILQKEYQKQKRYNEYLKREIKKYQIQLRAYKALNLQLKNEKARV